MIENILVFIIVSILVFTSKKKRAIGWLVFCYYAIYILIALDYFGFTFGDVYTTHESFTIWYLIYTAISLLAFMSAILIYVYTGFKTAMFYCCWIILNMFVSGLSAIFQAYETNSMLIVYNVLQNLNLLVDIIVVILGTDTKIKGTQYVRSAANYIYNFAISCASSFTKNSDRYK